MLSFFCYSPLSTSIFWCSLFCFVEDKLLPFPSFILVITGKFDLLDVFSWQSFSYHTLKTVYWYTFVFITKTFYCLNFLILYINFIKPKQKFVEMMESPFSYWCFLKKIFFCLSSLPWVNFTHNFCLGYTKSNFTLLQTKEYWFLGENLRKNLYRDWN